MTESPKEPDRIIALMERVSDRESFLEFAWALQQEAEDAQQLVWDNPEKFKYADPLGWAHLDVGHFLGVVLNSFEEHEGDFSWKDLAEALWSGKIIE
jgi:hypothetical protein